MCHHKHVIKQNKRLYFIIIFFLFKKYIINILQKTINNILKLISMNENMF